ncbi:MAG: phosphoglycerate dehydrogenase [Dehalococcoidia bacterium]|nr:phosphoglycerate dehydrogenase [Dehalococcoidia bacterium]
MPRVLVSDPLHPEGVALLQTATQVDVKTGLPPQELLHIIPDYEALVVRSETKVTKEVLEAGRRLQVVGRAGVGVDNIDLDVATRLGIAVVNAPTATSIAAAEHTIAMMMALARHVPQAYTSLRQGKWERSAFVGVEVRDKVLGIVGLGRIGLEVARRAQGLQMRIIGYDPFVGPDYARRLGVELVSLDEILAQSDFITLHTPLTETTHNLIGRKELARAKSGVRIINCARGGLVDEEALLEALTKGRVAGAALDVFAKEPPGENPLLTHPQVIATPHLGASTTEAQAGVGRQVAEQVLMVLRGEPAPYTANAFSALPEVHKVLAPYIPVCTVIGKIASQLAQGQLTTITIHYQGEIAHHDTSMLKAACLMGVLGPVTSERVNLVNASLLASQRGLRIVEEKQENGEEHYGSLVTVRLHTLQGTTSATGAVIRGEPHIVKLDDYWIDFVPSAPYLLFTHHQDQPGLIGAVGTITGKHDINISFMEVGRLAPRGQATMVLGLDDSIPETVLAEIRGISHIGTAKLVAL